MGFNELNKEYTCRIKGAVEVLMRLQSILDDEIKGQGNERMQGL